jgi:uncharacterized protein YgiM (DUF1202 family)
MEIVKEENKNSTLKKVIKHKGVIRNCKLLNIRKQSSLDSDILGVLNTESEFIINVKQSTNDFYKISYKGVNGYCLKKFVKIVGSERGE